MRFLWKMFEVLQNYVVDFVGYQFLSLIVVGFWLFGIFCVVSVFDNFFVVVKMRVDKVGLILVDVLIEKV